MSQPITEAQTNHMNAKSTTNLPDGVTLSDKSCFQVMEFSVPIPKGLDLLDSLEETPSTTATTTTTTTTSPDDMSNSSVVVGTITITGSSIMIWMSWNIPNPKIVPQMGPLLIATPPPPPPRLPYAKASSPTSPTTSPFDTAASSQLIGSSSDEDQMLSLQISTRLAKLIGRPVLVSCSLHSMAVHTVEMEGMANIQEEDGYGSSSVMSLVVRAAALAERKVRSLLLEWKDAQE